MAALEEGVITPTSHPVNCDGAYHYYAPDYEPGCLGVHGEVDVYGAIRNSCNAFFFDVGRMLTIHKMHTYAELFALGEKTGCELNETAGIMSDPKTYTERHGAIGMTASPFRQPSASATICSRQSSLRNTAP